jgi:hypothetical protein
MMRLASARFCPERLVQRLLVGMVGLSLAIMLLCASCGGQDVHTAVGIKGNQWFINGEPVLKGSPAEGLLMNVRMVNAVFEDRGPEASHLPKDFDPEKNTAHFISQIPDYVAHGVQGFTISLQGGLPGYEGAVNTAFMPDGTLRKEYLQRVEKVIRAADRSGAVVILSCFYQRQNQEPYALKGKQAILNAVTNVVHWIGDEKFSNVVLEVSNEFAHGGYRRWKDGEWLKSVDGQVELIRLAKKIAPELLVSTSGMGSGTMPPAIAEAADFIEIHFNRTPVELIPARVGEARAFGKPVLCNEDDKLGLVGAEAARVSVRSGAGWGFMHAVKNQSVPFEFEGAADDTAVYRMLQRLSTPGISIDAMPGQQRSVIITSPVDGDVFGPGKNIPIRATLTAIDSLEGLVVHFFANGKEIGSRADAPWEMRWDNAPPGKYVVMAIVKDTTGAEILRSGPADFEIRSE